MEFSERQEKIVEIVKNNGPITGEQIAEKLSLTRATLRPDLSILTMAGLLEARPRVGYFYVENAFDSLIAEKINHIKVRDVQSVPVVVRENSMVHDAVVKLFLEDVGTLFVVKENGVLEGVISRKDLLKSLMNSSGSQERQVPVGVLMTRMPNIVVAFPEETVLTAAHRLIRHEVDALPIVRPKDDSPEDYEVIGRLSKTNITRLFVELGEGR